MLYQRYSVSIYNNSFNGPINIYIKLLKIRYTKYIFNLTIQNLKGSLFIYFNTELNSTRTFPQVLIDEPPANIVMSQHGVHVLTGPVLQ